jgi:putative phage-type endonuclease
MSSTYVSEDPVPNPLHLINPGVRVLTEPETPRPQWLSLRKGGLGGSDALAAANLDPYRSPLRVWLEKTSSEPDDQIDNPHMHWGRMMEGPLLEWFTETTGIAVFRCGMLGHPSIDWMRFTPDALTTDDAIVEIKTVGPFATADAWGNGKTPDRAVVQVQHGMYVTGKQRAYVVGGIWGAEPQLRIIERDDAIIGELVKLETELWEHVTTETPPPLGQHPDEAALIRLLYPVGDPDTAVELSPVAYAALNKYLDLGERAKILTAQRAALQALVTAELGDATEGLWQGKPVVTWRNNAPISEKALRTEHPDLAAEYTIQRDALDTKALYRDHPELTARLRARRFLAS